MITTDDEDEITSGSGDDDAGGGCETADDDDSDGEEFERCARQGFMFVKYFVKLSRSRRYRRNDICR